MKIQYAANYAAGEKMMELGSFMVILGFAGKMVSKISKKLAK